MTRAVCTLSALTSVLAASPASAYQLKHSADGKTVRWGASRVAFVVDPSVEDAVEGGSAAAASAVGSWSGAGDGPTLSSSVGPGGAAPKLDGQNSIIFIPDGFEPAGHALAVTISSVEDATGELLDTDIVINGAHRFAVLAAGASDPGATPMPTDGAGEDEGERAVFDLEHVLAHEVGHAMGLADVRDDVTVLMYALTSPGSAANRAPTRDDEAGLQSLYAGSAAAQAPSAGCGQASVAGVRSRAGDVSFGLVALAIVGAGLAARRRKQLALPLAMGALVLGVMPDAGSRGAVAAPPAQVGATARVAATTTREVGGVLRTRVELVAITCDARCPDRPHAFVWGGVRDGVVQRVDGAAVPRVGETLEVAYVPGEDQVVVRRVGRPR